MRLTGAMLLLATSLALQAAEVSGVFVEDEYAMRDSRKLTLNGAGVREKFWIDIYVGSLYLSQPSTDVAAILSNPGAWRIQLDFIYKEVASEKLLEAWREGFEGNQETEILDALSSRIEQFYAYFTDSAVAGDQFAFDYLPGQGVETSKNGESLGVIVGDDFARALMEIWLGNKPADKALKRGMLGQ